MNVQEFHEFSVDKARELETTLEQIQPGLEELAGRLEEGEKSHTGDLRMVLSAEGLDHPSTPKINRALGFLAYNEILELEQRNVWMRSTSKYNDFYLDDFDEDRYEQSREYLSNRIDELEEVKKQDKKKYDFDEFDAFASGRQLAD